MRQMLMSCPSCEHSPDRFLVNTNGIRRGDLFCGAVPHLATIEIHIESGGPTEDFTKQNEKEKRTDGNKTHPRASTTPPADL